VRLTLTVGVVHLDSLGRMWLSVVWLRNINVRARVEKEETLNYERRMKKSCVAADAVASMVVSQVHDTGKVQKLCLTEAPIFFLKQTH
jgi:hypothetical protein